MCMMLFWLVVDHLSAATVSPLRKEVKLCARLHGLCSNVWLDGNFLLGLSKFLLQHGIMWDSAVRVQHARTD